jgi:hypothetical protein
MKNTLIFLLFISSTCFSQSKFNLITTIKVESDFITSDNQSNIYIVKGNELTKYDKTGKELYKYSNKNFGNISFVDASNMLKILVFYKDFLQVVLLDNTLSLNGEPVSLEQIGYVQGQLACTSHNSGMWIYDQQNFEIVRLDQNLIQTQKTGNLTAMLNTDLQPNFLLEYNNRVYLNNPSSGVLIFDVYGTYYKTLPVQTSLRFQPLGDWVYFFSGKNVKAYNILTSEEKQFEIPLTDFQNFRLEMGILILQAQNSIFLYTAE